MTLGKKRRKKKEKEKIKMQIKIFFRIRRHNALIPFKEIN